MTKRQEQARNTKMKIYDIAIDSITRKGYDNVTIQEICRKASVSIGTFYHYYAGKESIVVEIYKLADLYFEEAEKHLTSANAPDKIIEFIGHQMSYAQKRGIDLVTQVYKCQIQAGNEFFVSTERSLPRIIRKIVEEGQERRQIRTDMSPQEISSFVLRFSRGILYDWCVQQGKYDVFEEGRKAVTLLIYNCFATL